MPVEIKELHIRVSVNTPQNGRPTEPSAANSRDGTRDDKAARDAFVAECVEQVLEILQNKRER